MGRLNFAGLQFKALPPTHFPVRPTRRRTNLPSYRHFFAHHEIEAWLLCQQEHLPSEVQDVLRKLSRAPEQINFDKPPSKRISDAYAKKTARSYKKAVDGPKLFSNLDPDIAYASCPSLKAILDEMLKMAQAAGL